MGLPQLSPHPMKITGFKPSATAQAPTHRVGIPQTRHARHAGGSTGPGSAGSRVHGGGRTLHPRWRGDFRGGDGGKNMGKP